MSVVPRPWPQPAPQIAADIASMYQGKRERPLPVLVRDKLGGWLADEQFAGAYGVRGKPGWPPSRLALVTIFQRAGNLAGRQAAEAVRTRIDWKYAVGLEGGDPGFDHSVLPEFRARVAAGGLEQVVLDTLLARLAAEGLVKAGGKQRTDSTHVIAAVAALSRLELAGESVRAALEALAAAHPAWLEQRICVADFARRYGTPMTSWQPPASQARGMSWRSPAPATGTRCWGRSTTVPPRPGCASCPRWTCCAGCCCRTTPAPAPQAGGR
jgi:transposase